MRVPMATGEVVLLDTYQALHGRDCFEGRREPHGVVWLATRREEGDGLRCSLVRDRVLKVRMRFTFTLPYLRSIQNTHARHGDRRDRSRRIVEAEGRSRLEGERAWACDL